jgi:surfeit locus 1 family protein
MIVPAALVLAALIALGTWQVQRLQWKEALIAGIGSRIHAAPQPLAAIEKIFAETGIS